MGRTSIDINTDCGESFGNWTLGNDAMVIPEVSSVNLACGFHGGDPLTMLNTIDIATENGARVGAHPGLPDLLGFGRRMMDITPDDAYAYIVYQVGALQAALRTRGVSLQHVKPHGCLMSMVGRDAPLADAVACAIADTTDDPCVYFTAPLDGAALPKAAQRHGVRVVAEVYPDLAYDDDANVVVERTKVAKAPADCAAQLRRFLDDGRVQTLSGALLPLEAESICVHGDGPNAAEIIAALRAELERSDIAVRAPQGPSAATQKGPA